MVGQVLKRGTDILTVVAVDNLQEITADQLNSIAANTSSVPQYKPDGCGAILLFHTPDHKIHGLGGLRANSALHDQVTLDGTPFPEQVNTTIGGKLFDSSKSLYASIMDAIKFKMFFDANTAEDSPIYEAQHVIKSLLHAIAAPEGWVSDVCVHTDNWPNNDGSIGTMCYMTAIKHINGTYEDLAKIENALQAIMAYKKSNGENPRNLSDFKFYPFIPTMQNATNEYLIQRTELEKAQIAYQNGARITFNDLSLATFKANESYAKKAQGSIALSLPELTPAHVASI